MKSYASILLSILILQTNFAYAEEKKAEPKLPVVQLKEFTHVLDQIKKNYVTEVSDQQLFEGAMRGMLASLDPHSSYLDTETMNDLKVSTSGKFGGLGIEVTMEDGFVKIVSPIDDSPASKANLKSGDLIVKIDETPVKGLNLADAVSMMRGPKGSTIKLMIARPDKPQPFTVTLTRDIIKVESVKAKMLEPGYAYVRLSQFQGKSGEEMKVALEKLLSQNNGKLDGLILDMRNNPGGVLDAAVDISDLFLDSKKIGYDKLIVYTDGRMPSSKMREYARSNDVLKGAPMVVLVNAGSASASEIVAGALQDHRRAVIMGTQTFGKGSVQTVIPLQEDTGLKLTTARYYTPKGRSIQAEGIVPDVSLQEYVISQNTEDKSDFTVREKDLSGHLEQPKAPAVPEYLIIKGSDGKLDYGMVEALNLLKGMKTLR